jgi:hypothetical protein
MPISTNSDNASEGISCDPIKLSLRWAPDHVNFGDAVWVVRDQRVQPL